MTEFIYGHWAIMETLRANRREMEQLLITETLEEKGMAAEIIQTAQEKGVKVRRVPRRIIDDLAHGANHQSMALRSSWRKGAARNPFCCCSTC
jgi:tRNA G18 (ribose-2'-O)-methylase SpoU